jgi:hypothetical protein
MGIGLGMTTEKDHVRFGSPACVQMKRAGALIPKAVVPKHLQRPSYKYPSYTLKKQPTRRMNIFQNDEHFEEAMSEWKRKRALNNRSVRLCREKKQNELRDLEAKCTTLRNVNTSLEEDSNALRSANSLLLAALSNRQKLSPTDANIVRAMISKFRSRC